MAIKNPMRVQIPAPAEGLTVRTISIVERGGDQGIVCALPTRTSNRPKLLIGAGIELPRKVSQVEVWLR